MNEANDLMHLLDGLCDLPCGWDGYAGIPPSRRAVEKAKEIVGHLPGYMWQAVPGCDGSVQLEVHADGYDIEINIEAA